MSRMSKRSTPAGGQALVEYVLVLGLLSVMLGLLASLLRGAVAAAGLRFIAGLALLP